MKLGKGLTPVWLLGAALAADGLKVSARPSAVPGGQTNEIAGRNLASSIFGGHAFGLGGGQAAAPGAQAATSGRPMMSDEAFKNVQALKGIPVDDFMLT